MNNYYYHLYGLNVASPIVLPEADAITSPDVIDAILTFEAPPEWVLEEYHNGKYSSISPDIMWFRLYDEMLIYVANGREVRVFPLQEDYNPIRLRSYILTGAMTFLLLQRKFLLVHGSALTLNNQSFLISGASGAGKSTTTLELLKYPDILFSTDDICALRTTETESILYPGPPWQKVCPDVMQRETDEHFTYLEEAGGKYGRKLTDKYCSGATPVKGMFLLGLNDVNDITIREITGSEKLHALTHNLFRGELLNLLGITPDLMLQFLRTINQFPIYEVCRPRNMDTTQQLKRKIYHLMQTLLQE